MVNYKTKKFPKSRIATNDICAIGLRKHHVAALVEIDVTKSRQKLKQYKMNKHKVSFTAWLIKVISKTIKDYEETASYLKGKRKRIIFDDINVSIAVEKEISGQRVPIPLLVDKANEKTMESITSQINQARDKELTEKDIVLQTKSNRIERFYYHMPGFIRHSFWRFLLKHPQIANRKMGNVAITSLGMIGNVNGWFVPISVHPICFGIGKITKKPVVVNDNIEIREILNVSVLMDHDVVDGAIMARFISKLTDNIEQGIEL